MDWQQEDMPTAERFVEKYNELADNYSEAKSAVGSEFRQLITGSVNSVEEGLSLLTRFDVPLNHSSLLSFARELEDLLFTEVSELFHDVVSSMSSGDTPPNPVSAFAQKVLKGNGSYLTDLSKAHDIPSDILTFFGVYLVRPIRQLARQTLESHYAMDKWRFGYCPVCGLWPAMSRLEPEASRRILWCVGCNGEWRFPRVSCPFCFETDQEKLGYLTLEGWNAHRIYTCESCRRYLKTRDERVTAGSHASNLDADYLTSSLLDQAAIQERYAMDFVGLAAFDGLSSEAAVDYRKKVQITNNQNI